VIGIARGNNRGTRGVHYGMGLERFRTLLALPFASLFLILLACMFVVQRPASMGIRISIMRLRPVPLSNCEFNGFTVHLRSDGIVVGSGLEGPVPEETVLSRIKEARDNIQDETIFVIADPDVPYSKFAQLIADIHNAAPPDHIGVVTREGQITEHQYSSGKALEMLADRCRFEWPAVKGQPKWPKPQPTLLP